MCLNSWHFLTVRFISTTKLSNHCYQKRGDFQRVGNSVLMCTYTRISVCMCRPLCIMYMQAPIYMYVQLHLRPLNFCGEHMSTTDKSCFHDIVTLSLRLSVSSSWAHHKSTFISMCTRPSQYFASDFACTHAVVSSSNYGTKVLWSSSSWLSSCSIWIPLRSFFTFRWCNFH